MTAKRVLAIDVGNTRLKWGLAEGFGWIDGGTAMLDQDLSLLARWDRLSKPDCIIGSNVAGENRVAVVTAYWRKREVETKWIQSSVRCCGVSNHYEQPWQLGTDRWAALIGAWNKVGHSCLVVSAGTALTIDMLNDDGCFIGGQIIPGKRLMLECLISGTHALRDDAGEVKQYPLNTADAMVSGIANALVCSIESAFHRLELLARLKPACLITGGDAEWLASKLQIVHQVETRLVLDGLLQIAKEEGYS